jgi:hypothetical protein
MKNVEVFLLLLTVTCLVFLGIGLYRPWVMLWWEDVQNRRKVLKIYGLLSVIFFLAYGVIRWGVNPSY